MRLRPFRGKLLIVGGDDFKQILPVVHKGSTAQIINAGLHKSSLWERACIMHLTDNMRVRDEDSAAFINWLLSIGRGTDERVESETHGPDTVEIPEDL